ncbi:restriction endonuclease [Luteolibacter sp. Populi]|uniref:restriction endonuclease n=1 Tax=Luteolibacter sp. Populi TaxID=3230487 RepID=UPI0034666202
MTETPFEESKPTIDETKLTLEEWLKLIEPHSNDREYFVVDYQFPTDEHKDEYLATVHQRSDLEVKLLLRKFLIEGGSLGCDRAILELWLRNKEIAKRGFETEFGVRLITERHTWEGNTWVLDLLPSHPHEAHEVVGAYITAHMAFLPDGRWTGLQDAMCVIRARYFDFEHPIDHVMGLKPRDFEFLIATLFERMGYTTQVTRATRDGGYDIHASSAKAGSKQGVLIECKRRQERFGVGPIRELVGVLESQRLNKAFFVSCGSFTAAAHAFAQSNRIELIGWETLNKLLNQYLGQNWTHRLDLHISSYQRRKERVQEGNA